MSLCDLLRRRQAAAVPPVPCSPGSDGTEETLANQSGSPSSLGSPDINKGEAHQSREESVNDPGPATPEPGIDLLVDNLRFDFTGAPLHHIDDELAGMIRLAMMPMGQQERAELAVQIDDRLAEPEGRRKVMALLEETIDTQAPAI